MGTYYTTTIGFSRQPVIALLPITSVAIASLMIVCAVMGLKRCDRDLNSTARSSTLLAGSVPSTASPEDLLEVKQLETGENFDAGDPFHLLAVASAGGITDSFGRELSDIRIKMGHSVRLRLGRINHEVGESGVGLVYG